MNEAREIDLARRRLRLLGVVFAIALAGLGWRTVHLTFSFDPGAEAAVPAKSGAGAQARADIVDRNGVLLATDYPKTSVYADPTLILDASGLSEDVAEILDLESAQVDARLKRKGRFVWLKRHVSAEQRRHLIRLGDPGIGFITEMHRVYPQGALASHVVGYVGVENQGLAGIERSFDARLRGADASPLALTLDIRIQAVAHDVLNSAVGTFRALGGSAIVLEIETGDLLAAVSLPDFDPNDYQRSAPIARFNRNTLGTYELGSIFKLFTVAMALDQGTTTVTSGYDTREPFVLPPHRIRDFRGHARWMSVPEIVAFSSNIGAAHLAQALGEERQRLYFERLGLTVRAPIGLPEVAAPQLPSPWRPINTITAAYGHGIAVSPLQAADALAGLLCAAPRPPARLVDPEIEAGLSVVASAARRSPPVSPSTTAILRWLMWLTVEEGSGGRAAVEGYMVGGKTGSADQPNASGGYRDGRLLASFLGAFPMHAPRYVVLVTLDDPQGSIGTADQAQGGWTAAPAVGAIVRRIGPVLGIPPVAPEIEADFRARLVEGQAFNGRLKKMEPTFGAVPDLQWSSDDRGDGGCGCGPCSVIG